MGSSSATQALHQCTVVSIDDSSKLVKAFYNPSKIKISKSVPWQGHASAHSNAEVLEFTGAKNQTMAVDLFFDGYERDEDVSKHIDVLVQMTAATIPVSAKKGALIDEARGGGGGGGGGSGGGATGKAYRPHFVMLVWGDMPAFKGVIASVDTEYSMFMPTGKPVRATCSVKMTELHVAQMVNVSSDASKYRNELVRNRPI